MIIAAIYPVLVWFAVYKLRRSWVAFVLAGASAVGVWLLVPVLASWLRIKHDAIQILFYAEGALVGAIGLWLATLPRPERADRACGSCGYNLAGIDADAADARCPECGDITRRRERTTCPTCGEEVERGLAWQPGARCVHCATLMPKRH